MVHGVAPISARLLPPFAAGFEAATARRRLQNVAGERGVPRPANWTIFVIGGIVLILFTIGQGIAANWFFFRRGRPLVRLPSGGCVGCSGSTASSPITPDGGLSVVTGRIRSPKPLDRRRRPVLRPMEMICVA